MASLPSTLEQLPDSLSCQACIGLLADFIAASNELVKIKRRLAAKHGVAGRESATARLGRVTARQIEARERLLQYQRQHPCKCQNRF